MIRIIKHGTKRVNECNNCGCIFQYEKEDIKVEQAGWNEYTYTICCPDCKQEIKTSHIN